MEKFKLHGAMTAVLTKADGNTQVTKKDNMILDVGFDFIANAIGATSDRPAVMRGIAVGTDSTYVKSSDTGLKKLIEYKEAEFKHLSKSKTFTFVTTFGSGEAVGALTEAAVMTSKSGIALDRVTFPVINKGSEDELTVTFKFTMG